MYKASTKITVKGVKNGYTLNAVWDKGKIHSKSVKVFADLTKALAEPMEFGNVSMLSPDDPYKAKRVFEQYFDRILSITYDNSDPDDAYDPKAIY